jgi:glycine cleavage system aminomethyltransferase T
MAYLSSEIAQVGQTLDVDIRGTRATATIVDLPFYRRPQ